MMQVTAKLRLPKAACVLEFDHLLLSVDTEAAQLDGETERHLESLTANNYVAVPFTCSPSESFKPEHFYSAYIITCPENLRSILAR